MHGGIGYAVEGRVIGRGRERCLGAFNYAFTQMLLATHPNILVIK